MNNLTQHIQYLLRHHDCVIMPGIGAFVKSYHSATIDTDGSLLPPHNDISFNPSITTDDGLLAHCLMRRCGIAFEQARAEVANAAEQLRASLKTDRETTFGTIGTFSLGEDDNLCFTPFAAYPLPFVKVSTYDAAAEAARREERVSTRRFDTTRNFYIAINKRFAKVAAVLLVVIAAASTFVVPSLDNSTLSLPRVDRASVVPLPSKSTKTTTTQLPTAAPKATQEEQSGAIASEPQEGLSYLVVGTFHSISECDKYIASQPSDAGLKIATGKKLCRVYAAASADRDELLNTLRQDAFQELYPQAWIWQP